MNYPVLKHPKIWFCSDLHLGHHNLSSRRKRFFWPDGSSKTVLNAKKEVIQYDYETEFLNNWEELVGKDDIVCILGDVAFSSVGYWFSRIRDLPGKKTLVLGNHDRKPVPWYTKFGFELVVPFGEVLTMNHDYGKIMLSHIPVEESVLSSYDATRFLGLCRKFGRIFDKGSYILNIHGHTHGSATETHRTFDASLEAINYVPILLDQIIEAKFK